MHAMTQTYCVWDTNGSGGGTANKTEAVNGFVLEGKAESWLLLGWVEHQQEQEQEQEQEQQQQQQPQGDWEL
ncbi:hypothetical protein VM1G_11622 [Cytospora mali]|uniref:Uncharacterized protein n=1 Tax=Cytospora mali TaxID=578113 RepID=A0A194VZF1_CYTMA|nr:hypothetical protein VM1G_11622 [Valsa mali]